MARTPESGEPVPEQGPAGATSATPTADALRRETDSAATADKVAHSDPAAAPMGSDAEASGNPPSAEQLRMESRARRPLRAVAGRRPGGLGAFVAIGSVIGIALIVISLVLG
jgi:hypothetical protein